MMQKRIKTATEHFYNNITLNMLESKGVLKNVYFRLLANQHSKGLSKENKCRYL